MNNREILAKEIVNRFIGSISGSNAKRILKYNPNDRIYVGKLSPQSSADSFSSSVLIKQISVDFRVRKEDRDTATLNIYPQGNFFFRVLPTYEEEKEDFFEEFSSSFSSGNFHSFDEIVSAYKSGNLSEEMINHKISMLPVYEKIAINDGTKYLTVRLSDLFVNGVPFGSTEQNNAFKAALNDYVEDLCSTAKQRPNAVTCKYRDKLSIMDLLTEESWEKYKAKQTKREEFEMFLRFDFGIRVEVKEIDDYIDVSVALSNETQFGDETSDKTASKTRNDAYRINTLFNSGIKIRFYDCELVPIKLDYFADDYKYDPRVYALGNNCNIDCDLHNNEIQTNHVPVYIQNRLKTRDALAVKFVDLIGDPVVILNKIHEQMLVELQNWKKDYASRILTQLGSKQFKAEIDTFELEVKRFKTGIELIENYNLIRLSFVYMNTAFKNCAKGYDSWRLFQIVFVVSLILDIVANEPDLMLDDDVRDRAKTDDIDILYFPTGGGKTEAFLGILVFNLFFDRLRGKQRGSTAILKYPLRLLSVQQVQRLANILAMAELIRQEEKLGGEPFSLGYFVGEGNTPNKIEKDLESLLMKMSTDELDEKYRLLDICPFCRKRTIHISYNTERKSLAHYCSNTDCSSRGFIPIYMVDDDIYRTIPSVIISTVDKMTAIGLNMRFHNLLSGATYRCPKHGFTARTKCLVNTCTCDPDDFEQIYMKDPAPTLLIQDELHLIKESLGTYDSHYETFVEYFVKNLSGCNRGIKVIGATATISAYEIQAKHLYWKNAIRFPSPSPYLDHNFYSSIDKDDIGRIIIGYAPFGKAIVNSVAYSLQYLKRVVYQLYKNPDVVLNLNGINIDGTIDEQRAEVKRLLNDYWIILEYNNVKLESNRVLQALEDPINTELIAENTQPLVAKKMTGDDSFQEVRSTLSEIENAQSVIDDLAFNMIAATSMISHGVDADRFNLMLFYGMPGNTAEYIQAYSRVGRKHTGVVIDVMRPSREKDQSYLKNFVKFHEYKDILVDSVSINRWATKAVDNTLPGIISGILLNYYLYKLQYTNGASDISKFKDLKYALSNSLITVDEIKEHVYNIYKCSSSDSSIGKLYKSAIDKAVDSLFDSLKNGAFDGGMYLTEVFNKCYFHVMQSLRDTDKQIIVEMK